MCEKSACDGEMAIHRLLTMTENLWDGVQFLKRTKVVEEVIFKNGARNLKLIATTTTKIKDGTLAALNILKNLPLK